VILHENSFVDKRKKNRFREGEEDQGDLSADYRRPWGLAVVSSVARGRKRGEVRTA